MSDNLEHDIIVAKLANKIAIEIGSVAREYGDYLKSQGHDTQQVRMRGIDMYGEAIQLLKEKALEKEKYKTEKRKD